MLTRGDDYPIHQTAEPIAYAGTDRNFYDRYFFNGYPADDGGDDDNRMFAIAFGVYPQLNIADASFCWMANGRQINLHASRWLDMERMAPAVGPIRVTVEEPLQRLRITVDAPDQGIAADIVFTGRSFPIEESRFTRRVGPRTFLDYTRLTQNGRYSGWIEIDGARTDIEGYVGTRDRSWGVRPIGARDAQLPAPAMPPQFFWLWSPCVFADGDLFFHTNDDANGRPWNRRSVWAPLGTDAGEEAHFASAEARIDWAAGTRNAVAATIALDGGTLVFDPQATFFMMGLGYGHPVWGHGINHGELKVEREELLSADVDRTQPHHFHIQALSRVVWTDAGGRTRIGRGVLEQLVLGPYVPGGFTGMIDCA
ncbi:hypothetical protein [Sphingomonas oligophenolica]|uniref:Uncharacterized protein n=1 Tax=Sphingomonas oligophenolica TaxID=301154 RepID=A0A502CP97_9SPHN|nr:hypothetical protein [Sphingomonas oligophenolica]TPG14572.1 hypothetical protein EAH84_04625 [Sphingomonas oligophenolica]